MLEYYISPPSIHRTFHDGFLKPNFIFSTHRSKDYFWHKNTEFDFSVIMINPSTRNYRNIAGFYQDGSFILSVRMCNIISKFAHKIKFLKKINQDYYINDVWSVSQDDPGVIRMFSPIIDHATSALGYSNESMPRKFIPTWFSQFRDSCFKFAKENEVRRILAG